MNPLSKFLYGMFALLIIVLFIIIAPHLMPTMQTIGEQTVAISGNISGATTSANITSTEVAFTKVYPFLWAAIGVFGIGFAAWWKIKQDSE